MKKNISFINTKTMIFAGLVLELIHRIILQNWMTPDGLALFTVAYAVYGLLWVINTMGIPIAMSELILSRMEKGDKKSAQTVFFIYMIVSVAISLVICAILIMVSDPLAEKIGFLNGEGVIRWLAPCFFFSSVLGAFRGYFRGMKMSILCNFSVLVEQVVKVAGSVVLLFVLSKASMQERANGATIVLAISLIASLVFLGVLYMLGIDHLPSDNDTKVNVKIISKGKILRHIFSQGALLSVGSAILPIMAILDILFGMGSLTAQTNQTTMSATTAYGLWGGFVFMMLVFSAIVTAMFANRYLPAIENALEQEKMNTASRLTSIALRIGLIVGFFGAMILAGLAEPLVQLVMPSVTGAELTATIAMLRIAAVGMIFVAVGQVANAIFMQTEFAVMSVIIALFSFIVKVILMKTVTPFMQEPILGMAFSTVVALGIYAIISCAYLSQLAHFTISLSKYIIRLILIVAVVGIGSWALYQYVWNRYISIPWVGSVIALLLGIVAFLGLVFAGGIFPMKKKYAKKQGE